MRLLAPFRTFSLRVLAGGVAGLLVGVLARIAMRISAWSAGASRQGLVTAERALVGDVTLPGTIEVILIGGLVGVAGGALFAMVRPLLPARREGLAFGLVALALSGWTILDPANSDFRRFGYAPLNYAMFAGMFLVYGGATVRMARWLDARASRTLKSHALWVPLAWLGGALAFMNAAFGTEDRPGLALAVIALVGVAHLVRSGLRLSAQRPHEG